MSVSFHRQQHLSELLGQIQELLRRRSRRGSARQSQVAVDRPMPAD
jgi:hypothetical protein